MALFLKQKKSVVEQIQSMYSYLNYSLLPKSVISCRPVGILSTEDQGGIDPKIIAVPLTKIDPSFSTILDINDVPQNLRMQLKHFIEHHKDLEEGKYVNVEGWE